MASLARATWAEVFNPVCPLVLGDDKEMQSGLAPLCALDDRYSLLPQWERVWVRVKRAAAFSGNI